MTYRVIGIKHQKLAKLNLPGDIKKYLDDPTTKSIKSTLGEFGIISEPVFRREGKKLTLITGRKRIAACMAEGVESIDIKVVECSDAQAEKLELIENACRRHDQEEQSRLMTELVDMFQLEVLVERTAAIDQPRVGGGRPKSARGEARDRAAAAAGTKPATVAKAEQRQKAAAEAKAKEKANPPIDTMGIELGEDYLTEMRIIQGFVERSLQMLVQVQAAMTSLEGEDLNVSAGRVARVRDEAHNVATMLRDLLPYSVCPFCKVIEEVQDHCTACDKLGWVTKLQWEQAPDGLKVLGDQAIVMIKGKEMFVSDLDGDDGWA